MSKDHDVTPSDPTKYKHCHSCFETGNLLKNEENHQGGSCEPYEWQLETVPGNVARMHPMLWEPRTTMERKGRRDTTFIPPLAAGCINVRKKHSPPEN